MATPKPPVQSDTTLTIAPSSATVNPGESFDLMLQIATDQMTFAMQAGLAYDPKLVEVLSVKEGDFYKAWAAANGAQTLMVPGKVTPDNENGQMTVVGVSLLGQDVAGKGPSGNGTWLVVSARAKEGAQGVANFELTDVKVLDVDPVKPIPMAGVKTVAGQVSIGGAGPAVMSTAVLVASPTPAAGAAKAAPNELGPAATVQVIMESPAEAQQPSSESQTSQIPWELIAPVAGVAVIGAVVVVSMRRRSS
jgi:hypothetical protein